WGSGAPRRGIGDGSATTRSCGGGCGSWPPSGAASAIGACTPCCGARACRPTTSGSGASTARQGCKCAGGAGRGPGRGRGPWRRAAGAAPSRQWALDFLSDALAWGRRIRLLAVVDTCTREALAIEVDTSLPGQRVARVRERLVAERGAPDEIVLDNG